MIQELYKIRKIFYLAYRSLLLQRLRAFLSLLGVIFGVMAVLAMLCVGEGAKRESVRQIEQLGTQNIIIKAVSLTQGQERKAREMLTRGLSAYDGDRLRTGNPSIESVALLKEIKATIRATNRDITPQIAACSADYMFVQALPLAQGRFLSQQDEQERHAVCILGNTLADALGEQGKIGNHLQIENHLFKIVGVLHRKDQANEKSAVIALRNYNEMILIPLGTEPFVESALSDRQKPLTELIIRMNKIKEISDVANWVKRTMEITHGGVEDYQIIIPLELIRQAEKTQRTFNLVLGSIAFISLLVGGIGIMNIMLATVSERTGEIGIRRALGATRPDIIAQFLAEAIILTLTGGIFGIIAGLAGVWAISMMAGWKTVITLWAVSLPLVTAVLIGVVFGLYPAYKGAHMNPITALKYE